MAATTQSITGMLGSDFSQTGTGSTTQSAASAMDANSFLTMFLTQLKYQDPNNPLQAHELASQLAQFTQVQKLSEATTLLQNIQSYSAAINNAEMASLVGKDVTAQYNSVAVSADSVGTLDYALDQPLQNVTVTIRDARNQIVSVENRGVQAAGKYQVEWNGKDTNGDRVPEGTYTVEIAGMDAGGDTATVRTTVHGTVNTFNMEGSNPYYILSGLSGIKIPVADVFEIAVAGQTL